MKNYRTLLLLCLLGFSSFAIQAQGLLGIGVSGISGLPALSQFGDTIQNLSIWVVNQGVTPVGSLSVAFISQTNSTGAPFQVGSLDLSGTMIQPGDSMYVPLDYFIVTPQNSNQGSNVMVIWPTAPGTTPSDSAEADYEVDGPTDVGDPNDPAGEVTAWPNPTTGILNVHVENIELQGSLLQLFDPMGGLVIELDLENDQQIDFTPSAAGTYTLQVMTDGGIVVKRKIIKQ